MATIPAALMASALGILLSACAPARQATTAGVAPSMAKGAFDSPDAGAPDRADGRTDAPTAAELLAGDAGTGSPQSFRNWFGAPDSARREARGALWTYRLPGCAIVAIFTLDSANRPLLRALEALPRDAGATTPADPSGSSKARESAPLLDTCLETAAKRASTGRPFTARPVSSPNPAR